MTINYSVELQVIWNTKTFMLRHCNGIKHRYYFFYLFYMPQIQMIDKSRFIGKIKHPISNMFIELYKTELDSSNMNP